MIRGRVGQLFEVLLLATLAPVLWLQGVYVRRVTPRLPEPEGKRQGTQGSGSELRVLILGDSAAAGVGVDHQQEALSGQLAQHLGREYRLSWRLLAQSGHTARDILVMLAAHPDEAFDVVLVSVGVNDVTARNRPQSWLRSMDALVAELRSRYGTQRIFFTELPPMHRFPALPQPLRTYLGLRVHRFNADLEKWAATKPACAVLRIPAPDGDQAIAEDGFHPGLHFYAVWAEIAAQAIRQEIPPA